MDLDALLVSLPVSAWVAAILVINEVPDIEADRRAGKLTLVVRWGARGARSIYACLTTVALAAAAWGLARHCLPLGYAAPAILFAGLGVYAIRGISSELPRSARG